MHEILADKNRSSLKIHYTSLDDDDEEEEDEDETSKDVKDDDVKAAIIANFIPGTVSIFLHACSWSTCVFFLLIILSRVDRLSSNC